MSSTMLARALLYGACLRSCSLKDAHFDGAVLGFTSLIDVDVTQLACARQLVHENPSTVDYSTVIRSLYAPDLRQFLVDTGMPQIFADYMIDCARALSPQQRFTLMLSTFISYGGPDGTFAKKLNKRLSDAGVPTFFYPLDAKLGELNARTMRQVHKYDRVAVICSERSLARSGVLCELTEAMKAEAELGGQTVLIPITLDDYVFSDDFKPPDSNLKALLLERCIGDFRGADKDDAVLDAQLPRLVEALRRPVDVEM